MIIIIMTHFGLETWKHGMAANGKLWINTGIVHAHSLRLKTGAQTQNWNDQTKQDNESIQEWPVQQTATNQNRASHS
jgi:hypothetical protein